MTSRVAAQLYTLRDHTKSAGDLASTLQRVSQIGYRAVQMSAVGAMDGDAPLVDARAARRMLDDCGLSCIATHRQWDRLAGETSAEIDFHHELGCRFAAIGGLPQRYSADGPAGYRRFLLEARTTIARLRGAGIRFGVHNHWLEFERFPPDRRTLYDILIDEGGEDLHLEVDVCWAVHAGVNPVRIFERIHGRSDVIHAKDLEVVAGKGPVVAPVGEGNLDWTTILPACKRAGVLWYAVEQDECRRDPFDCLRSSYNYLRERGV